MIRETSGFIPYQVEEPETVPAQKPTHVGRIDDEEKFAFIGAPPKTLETRQTQGFEPYKEPEKPEEDSTAKSIARWFLQVPLGALQRFTYPADLLNLISAGAAFDENEIQAIEREYEKAGKTFDRQRYIQTIHEIAGGFPTQGNIERIVEEKTGLPLQPKTKGQKLLRMGGEGAAFTHGGPIRKAVGGVATPAVTAGLEAVGVPEPLAEMAGLGIGTMGASIAPAVELKYKPSGMPAFQFEKLQNVRVVTPAQKQAIDASVENEFRKASSRLAEESLGKETAAELADPKFEAVIEKELGKVGPLFQQIKETVHSDNLRVNFLKRGEETAKSGAYQSEYQKAYEKHFMEIFNKIKSGELSAHDLYVTYRANNRDLIGYFEPGQNYNYNQAKRDALLDANRAIVDTLKEKYPNSEVIKLFEQTNEQYSKIQGYKLYEKVVDEIFLDGVNHGKGAKALEKKGIKETLTRLLGKEGYDQLKGLMGDFLEQRKGYKMIREGKPVGLMDIMKDLSAWYIHPVLGTVKTGAKYVKHAMNMLLDKPQMTIQWRAGIDALKKGETAKAAEIFQDLEQQAKTDLEIIQPPAVKAKAEPKPEVEIDITPKKPVQERKLLEGPANQRKRIEGPKESPSPTEPKVKQEPKVTPVTPKPKMLQRPKEKKEIEHKPIDRNTVVSNINKISKVSPDTSIPTQSLLTYYKPENRKDVKKAFDTLNIALKSETHKDYPYTGDRMLASAKELKDELAKFSVNQTDMNTLKDKTQKLRAMLDETVITTPSDLPKNGKVSPENTKTIMRKERRGLKKPNKLFRLTPKNFNVTASDDKLSANFRIQQLPPGSPKSLGREKYVKPIKIQLDPEDELRFFTLRSKGKNSQSKEWKSLEKSIATKQNKRLQEGRPIIPINIENEKKGIRPAGVLGDYFTEPFLKAKFSKVLDYPVAIQDVHKMEGISPPLGYYIRGEPIVLSTKLLGKNDMLTNTLIHEATHLLQDTKSRITYEKKKAPYSERIYEQTARRLPKHIHEKRGGKSFGLPQNQTEFKDAIIPKSNEYVDPATLKKQKEYALQKIDNLKESETSKTLTLKIPGDGTFHVPNNQTSVDNFKKAVTKYWPKSL